MRAQSPGKLILSGEHAVLHGASALAVAVDRYAEVSVTQRATGPIIFELLDLDYHKAHGIPALRSLKRRIQSDYERFVRGECGIRHVIKRPVELSQFLVTHIFDQLKIHLSEGFKIKAHGNIPVGCGMGSSSAIIMSLLHAVINELTIDVDKAMYLSIGKTAEQLQHGYSSGLDLHLSLYGGCQWYEKGESRMKPLPEIDFFCVHTGAPASSTGECVEHTQSYFQDDALVAGFKQVTHDIYTALQNNHIAALIDAVKQNHQWLQRIGVVPEKISQFIANIEQSGGAAKICGAGAIRGNHSGMVWLVGADKPALQRICEQWGFQTMILKGEGTGVRIL